MSCRTGRTGFTCGILIGTLVLRFATAQEPPIAQLLPASTIAYVEILDPQKLLGTVLDHPLRSKIEALDQVRRAKELPKYLEFKAVVAMIEARMGMPWRKILQEVAGDSLVLAFDPASKGVALVAHSPSSATTKKLIDTVVDLANGELARRRVSHRIQATEYRGTKVFALDKIDVALAGDFLIAANNRVLGKQILDGYIDRPKGSLVSDADFLRAREMTSKEANVWAYVDIAALRRAGTLKKLTKGAADNPLVELLIGGIVADLQRTPLAALWASLTHQHLQFGAAIPHDPSWSGEAREFYFGSDGMGAVDTSLQVHDQLLSLSLYRDLANLWHHADDLFNRQINDDLVKADSTLSTFFGGKDFADDILAAFKPDLQLLVAAQAFPDARPIPTIKLPAFALVAQLKDAAAMQPELRRTFQSLIGFLNIVGAMNGNPQLELDMEKSDLFQLVTTRFLPDTSQEGSDNVRIHHNFSPSIGFAADRFVIASTQDIARELVQARQVGSDSGSSTDRKINSRADLDITVGRRILEVNRPQLVAQNMLSDGHTKDEAEAAISTLLELVGWLRTASMKLVTSKDSLQFDINVQAVSNDP